MKQVFATATARICVTEPRRVAAVSVAARVGVELNEVALVGHQIRYDSAVSQRTRLKFCTDGILLAEVQSDFLLLQYNAIVVDEAHERSMNTDVLLGLLSRIVPLRRKLYEEQLKKTQQEAKGEEGEAELFKVNAPLKLIIMSATLRVEDFAANARLFPSPPPIVRVSARQHPVTIHFNRRTAANYVQAAFKKVCKIHQQLPQGAILVFLTGKQEIEQLCTMLATEFKSKRKNKINVAKSEDEEASEGQEEKTKLDPNEVLGVQILPLYSRLSNELQMKVF